MDHGKILALDTPAGLKKSVAADTMVVLNADGDLDALGEMLRRAIPGVQSAAVFNGRLQLGIRGVQRVLMTVIDAVEDSGFKLTDVGITEPTLETVFINLTGKALRD
jgi:ABC-2 type transport system ATP-binding protein